MECENCQYKTYLRCKLCFVDLCYEMIMNHERIDTITQRKANVYGIKIRELRADAEEDRKGLIYERDNL